jgi:hypothetical protein
MGERSEGVGGRGEARLLGSKDCLGGEDLLGGEDFLGAKIA